LKNKQVVEITGSYWAAFFTLIAPEFCSASQPCASCPWHPAVPAVPFCIGSEPVLCHPSTPTALWAMCQWAPIPRPWQKHKKQDGIFWPRSAFWRH